MNRIDRRCEQGIPHDPRSEVLYAAIADLDFEEGGDFFCFQRGGDGDNGEHLMYLLDLYFEAQDTAPANGPITRGDRTPGEDAK